jgi:hypothetical protein
MYSLGCDDDARVSFAWSGQYTRASRDVFDCRLCASDLTRLLFALALHQQITNCKVFQFGDDLRCLDIGWLAIPNSLQVVFQLHHSSQLKVKSMCSSRAFKYGISETNVASFEFNNR